MNARRRVRRVLAAAGIACAAGQLIGIAAGIGWLRNVTKPPLMLLLAGYTVTGVRRGRLPATAPLLAGLVLSSAGDTALLSDDERAFLTGLTLFAGAHLCYIAGCLNLGAAHTLRRRPWIAVGVLACYLALVHPTWQRAGDLRWPLIAYGLLLFAMAAVALATNLGMGVGAALFAVSDLMIGLRVVGIEFPHQDLAVMLTYCAGQVLIALNWRPVADADR